MTAHEPAVLRDIPLGARGDRGRLLWITPDAAGRHRFVFYRGTNQLAKTAVGGTLLVELRALFDRRNDVERRAGQHVELDYAIGGALDLPPTDTEVRRIAGYLQAFPPAAA